MFIIANITNNMFTGKFEDYDFTMYKLYMSSSIYPIYTVGIYNITLEPDDEGNYSLYTLSIKGDRYMYRSVVENTIPGLETPNEIGPKVNKGTWLIRLVLQLISYLGIKSLHLIDISTVKIGEYDVELRLVRMILGKKSWYASYGFIDCDPEFISNITSKLFNYPINNSIFGIYMKNLYDISPISFAEELENLYHQDDDLKYYIDTLGQVEMELRLE